MASKGDFWKRLIYDPKGHKKPQRWKPNRALVRAASTIGGRVTDAYFNTRVEGAEHIPRKGGAIIVANHGFLAGEGPILHSAIVRKTGRVPRIIGAHFLWRFPAAALALGRAGVVKGDRDVAHSLLEKGEILMIYPGGVREAAKGPDDRERLFWEGRTGFIKVALRAGVPVVPAAILGADDMFWRSESRLDIIGELTGDPDAAMPLFMGLGPLPLPVNLKVRFAPPVLMEGGEDAAEDDELVQSLQDKVRLQVETLLGYADATPRDPFAVED